MRHPGLPVATTCGRAAAREASLGASTARDIAGSTSVNRPALPQHWAASGRVVTRSTGIAPSIRSGGPAIPCACIRWQGGSYATVTSSGAPGRGPRSASSSLTSRTRAANASPRPPTATRWPYSFSIAPHPALLTTMGVSSSPKAAMFVPASRRASSRRPACAWSAPQHTCGGTSRTSYPFTWSVRMVASCTWEKRPSITHPRNSRAGEGGGGRWRAVEASVAGAPPFTALHRLPPPCGFVAASIPIANRIRHRSRGTSGRPGDRSRNAHRSPALRSRPDPSFRAFDGHHERLARVERAPQPGDERPYAFAVGPEMADRCARRPGGALERERHFEPRERAAQPPQAVHGGLAAPANRSDARARRDPLVPHLMLQEVNELVARVGQSAHAERHRPRGEALGRTHPQGVRLVRAERGEASSGGGAQRCFFGGHEGGRAGETDRQHPPFAPRERR